MPSLWFPVEELISDKVDRAKKAWDSRVTGQTIKAGAAQVNEPLIQDRIGSAMSRFDTLTAGPARGLMGSLSGPMGPLTALNPIAAGSAIGVDLFPKAAPGIEDRIGKATSALDARLKGSSTISPRAKPTETPGLGLAPLGMGIEDKLAGARSKLDTLIGGAGTALKQRDTDFNARLGREGIDLGTGSTVEDFVRNPLGSVKKELDYRPKPLPLRGDEGLLEGGLVDTANQMRESYNRLRDKPENILKLGQTLGEHTSVAGALQSQARARRERPDDKKAYLSQLGEGLETAGDIGNLVPTGEDMLQNVATNVGVRALTEHGVNPVVASVLSVAGTIAAPLLPAALRKGVVKLNKNVVPGVERAIGQAVGVDVAPAITSAEKSRIGAMQQINQMQTGKLKDGVRPAFPFEYDTTAVEATRATRPIEYASSSPEMEAILRLEKHPEVESWRRPDKAKDIIPYTMANGETGSYVPDFIVKYRGGRTEVIEIKAAFRENTPAVQARSKAAQQWAKDRGYKYALVTEADLGQFSLRARSASEAAAIKGLGPHQAQEMIRLIRKNADSAERLAMRAVDPDRAKSVGLSGRASPDAPRAKGSAEPLSEDDLEMLELLQQAQQDSGNAQGAMRTQDLIDQTRQQLGLSEPGQGRGTSTGLSYPTPVADDPLAGDSGQWVGREMLKSAGIRGGIGTGVGAASGAVYGEKNELSPHDRAGAIVAGGLLGTAAGVGASAGGLLGLEKLIKSGKVRGEYFSSHPDMANRVRAAMLAAAENTPPGQTVQVPAAIESINRLESGKAGSTWTPELERLVSGTLTPEEVKGLISTSTSMGRVWQAGKDLIADAVSGLPMRIVRGEEYRADRGATLLKLNLPALEQVDSIEGMVRQVAEQLGVPVPRVIVRNNPDPNALAPMGGRALEVTSGLMELGLSKEELAWVIAHELVHATPEGRSKRLTWLVQRAVEKGGKAEAEASEGLAARFAKHSAEMNQRLERFDALGAEIKNVQEQIEARKLLVESRKAGNGIERPPAEGVWASWGGRITDNDLMEIAARSGIEQFGPQWWEALDPEAVRIYKAEVMAERGPSGSRRAASRSGGKLTADEKRLRAEHRQLEQQLEQDMNISSNLEEQAAQEGVDLTLPDEVEAPYDDYGASDVDPNRFARPIEGTDAGPITEPPPIAPARKAEQNALDLGDQSVAPTTTPLVNPKNQTQLGMGLDVPEAAPPPSAAARRMEADRAGRGVEQAPLDTGVPETGAGLRSAGELPPSVVGPEMAIEHLTPLVRSGEVSQRMVSYELAQQVGRGDMTPEEATQIKNALRPYYEEGQQVLRDKWAARQAEGTPTTTRVEPEAPEAPVQPDLLPEREPAAPRPTVEQRENGNWSLEVTPEGSKAARAMPNTDHGLQQIADEAGNPVVKNANDPGTMQYLADHYAQTARHLVANRILTPEEIGDWVGHLVRSGRITPEYGEWVLNDIDKWNKVTGGGRTLNGKPTPQAAANGLLAALDEVTAGVGGPSKEVADALRARWEAALNDPMSPIAHDVAGSNEIRKYFDDLSAKTAAPREEVLGGMRAPEPEAEVPPTSVPETATPEISGDASAAQARSAARAAEFGSTSDFNPQTYQALMDEYGPQLERGENFIEQIEKDLARREAAGEVDFDTAKEVVEDLRRKNDLPTDTTVPETPDQALTPKAAEIPEEAGTVEALPEIDYGPTTPERPDQTLRPEVQPLPDDTGTMLPPEPEAAPAPAPAPARERAERGPGKKALRTQAQQHVDQMLDSGEMTPDEIEQAITDMADAGTYTDWQAMEASAYLKKQLNMRAVNGHPETGPIPGQIDNAVGRMLDPRTPPPVEGRARRGKAAKEPEGTVVFESGEEGAAGYGDVTTNRPEVAPAREPGRAATPDELAAEQAADVQRVVAETEGMTVQDALAHIDDKAASGEISQTVGNRAASKVYDRVGQTPPVPKPEPEPVRAPGAPEDYPPGAPWPPPESGRPVPENYPVGPEGSAGMGDVTTPEARAAEEAYPTKKSTLGVDPEDIIEPEPVPPRVPPTAEVAPPTPATPVVDVPPPPTPRNPNVPDGTGAPPPPPPMPTGTGSGTPPPPPDPKGPRPANWPTGVPWPPPFDAKKEPSKWAQFWQKLDSARYSTNMLARPAGGVRDLFGTMFSLGLAFPRTAIASGIEGGILQPLGGVKTRERSAVLGQSREMANAFFPAWKEGRRKAADVWKKGLKSEYSSTLDAPNTDLFGTGKKGQIANRIVEGGYRIRLASDAFNAHIGEEIAVAGLAYREAVRAGLERGTKEFENFRRVTQADIKAEMSRLATEAQKSGGKVPQGPVRPRADEKVAPPGMPRQMADTDTTGLAEEAFAIAKGLIFQQEPGFTAKNARNMFRGAMRGPVPMFATLANIGAKWAEHHPLVGSAGVAFDLARSRSGKAGEHLLSGPYAPVGTGPNAGNRLTSSNSAAVRPISQRIASVTMGAATSAIAYGLVANGLMTDNGPSDTAVKRKMMNEGWRPLAIPFPDGDGGVAGYVPIEWLLGPLAGAAGFGAEQAGRSAREEEPLSVETWQKILMNQSSQWAATTGLRPVYDLMQAVMAPDEEEQMRSLEDLVGDTLGGALPAGGLLKMLNDVAGDEYQRDPQTTEERIKAQIPGLREDVPYRTDEYGEPVRRGSTLTRLGNLINPATYSEAAPGARAFFGSDSPESDAEITKAINAVDNYRRHPDQYKVPTDRQYSLQASYAGARDFNAQRLREEETKERRRRKADEGQSIQDILQSNWGALTGSGGGGFVPPTSGSRPRFEMPRIGG